MVIGDVEIDLASRVTRKAGNDVHLTPIEFRLLAHLCAHAGKVLTHRQIVKEVWGPSHIEQTHYPRIFMQHLRQKLEDDPAQPKSVYRDDGVASVGSAVQEDPP